MQQMKVAATGLVDIGQWLTTNPLQATLGAVIFLAWLVYKLKVSVPERKLGYFVASLMVVLLVFLVWTFKLPTVSDAQAGTNEPILSSQVDSATSDSAQDTAK